MSQLVLSAQKISGRKIQDAGYQFHYETLEPALREICEPPYRGFQIEQWVPRHIEETFAFFHDPRNLELLTPHFLSFKIIGSLPNEMKNGTFLNYRMRLRGVPIRWQSKILDWNPPHGFSDTQTRGPYAYWKHYHEFYEQDGGTLIRDRVFYKLPFGFAGDVVAGPFVRKDLQSIFTFRRSMIKEAFCSDS